MDVTSASGMNQASSHQSREIQGKGSYQEGCPTHSTDPPLLLETVLEKNATPNINVAWPYHLFKETTVEELRSLVRMAFSLASHKGSSNTSTKIKWTKPADWPDDVYFGDPNNGKQNKKKPEKYKLIEMQVELFKRLKLQERMVQLLEKHTGKERDHPLTQLLKKTKPLYYIQDTATDNNKLMDSSESDYSNIQERQKKPQESIINQGSKEEEINFDVREASKGALGNQPALALPLNGFCSYDVFVGTNSQVCWKPDDIDARLNDCRTEKDEGNLNLNDLPSDQASHGDTICSIAEVSQLKETSADPWMPEYQDAEIYQDNQLDLVYHEAGQLIDFITKDKFTVDDFESMEWVQQDLVPSLTLNALEVDIQLTADEKEIYPDLKDLDNPMQCNKG